MERRAVIKIFGKESTIYKDIILKVNVEVTSEEFFGNVWYWAELRMAMEEMIKNKEPFLIKVKDINGNYIEFKGYTEYIHYDVNIWSVRRRGTCNMEYIEIDWFAKVMNIDGMSIKLDGMCHIYGVRRG